MQAITVNEFEQLHEAIQANTRALKNHIAETGHKFDGLTDIVTRVAHAVENTQDELTSHKAWEENYHREERKKAKEWELKFDKLIQDLSLYFNTKSTAKHMGKFGLWLGSLGLFGAGMLWLLGAIQTLLKKVGLF